MLLPEPVRHKGRGMTTFVLMEAMRSLNIVSAGLDALPVEVFEKKLKIPELEAFSKTRKFDSPLHSWKTPRQGKAADIGNGDRSGPCLVEVAYKLRNSPVIARVPELPSIQPSPVVIAPPTVITFTQSEAIKEFVVTEEWCWNAFNAVASIEQLGEEALRVHLRNLDGINKHVRLLSKMLIERLPNFLASRLPSDRPDLQPGCHWNWSSLRDKVARISVF